MILLDFIYLSVVASFFGICVIYVDATGKL